MEPISVEAMTNVPYLEKLLADLTTEALLEWSASAQAYRDGESISSTEPAFVRWQKIRKEHPEALPDPIVFSSALAHSVVTLLARNNATLLEQLGQRKKRSWFWAHR